MNKQKKKRSYSAINKVFDNMTPELLWLLGFMFFAYHIYVNMVASVENLRSDF